MSKRSEWTRFSEELTTAALEARPVQPKPAADNPLTPRIFVLALGFALVVVALFARLALLQVFAPAARAATASAATLTTERGEIVDRDGLLLAIDSYTWEIYLRPGEARRTGATPEQLAAYAGALRLPVEALTQAATQETALAVVAKNVTSEQCDIADHATTLPVWIWCDGKRKRVYPHGGLAAHLLGFTDVDLQGRSGIEAYYDHWLRSSEPWPPEQLPGPADPLPQAWSAYLPSLGGRDLVLHTDAPLQYLVEGHLADAIREHQAKAGSIVALDPRTGGVLALANWPTFDPNQYATAEAATWINAALSESYEPGSVFKLITYAAALDSGKITADTLLYDAGKLVVSGKEISNAEGRQYGRVTARQALASSINVVSAEICLDMGADTFYRYVRQFGFGRITEADMGPESNGIVKWPGTRFWSKYEQAANSFGQGISVTPLQMANAVAAIANQGTLLQPQFAQALVYNGQAHRLAPRVLGQAIRPETARTLTQMMVFTVESYAAGANLVPGYRVAGKTGTAEIPQEGGYTSELTITTFVGFLPAANPQLVILVKLVEPKSSRWAEQVALPVFGRVARDAVQVLQIQPDERLP